MEDLKQGRYDLLSLCTPRGAMGRRGSTHTLSGHCQAPHMAFDVNVNTVLLSGIPLEVSVWDLCDVLQMCNGFCDYFSTVPVQGGVTREMRARFSSANSAREAVKLLSETKLGGDCVLRPTLVDPSLSLEALVAPREMSHPVRIAKDLELSSQIIRKLDKLMFIPNEVTEFLLGREVPVELKLDFQILYLRRAHHFCLYAATWCDDEWDLSQKCGAAVLRDGTSNELSPAEGDWAKAHNNRLEKFLETVQYGQPFVPTYNDEPIQSRVFALCEEKTKQVSEQKYMCNECGKHFRGRNYVRKHLRKVHADLFEIIRLQVHEEMALAAFRKDKFHPTKS